MTTTVRPTAEPINVVPATAEPIDVVPAEAPVRPPLTEPTVTQPPTQPRGTGVSTLHRAIVLLAVMTLFVGTFGDWGALIWPHPEAAALIMVGYGLILVLAILALTVRRARIMAAVDIGVLLVTLLVRLPSFFVSFPPVPLGGSPYPNDEGPLVDLAGRALSHGLDPYNVIWTAPLIHPMPGITGTMAGGIVDTYDYPPLGAILDYLVRPLTGGVPPAAVVAMAALVIATVVTFCILPTPWRCVAPMAILGFDLMPHIARDGYQMIMMLPFLFVAVAGWARIGRPRSHDTAGSLRAHGWASAICLGLAMSTQQLAWFIAPFLVLGLLVVRIGDLPRGRAFGLAAKYAGVAAGIFAAVNLPFAITDFASWSRGVLLPLTDAATPHGQGLIDISYYLVGGSGNMSGYSNAAIALLIGLLIVSVLFMRTVGPAVVVLPWAAFYLAMRSQDNYFLVTAPLWIISLATLRPADFATAWQPWPAARPRWAMPVRALAFVALLVPAGLLVTSAVTSPQPLRMVIQTMTTSKSSGKVRLLNVEVTNLSGGTITPHFALSNGAGMSRFFVAISGPESLARGTEATYTLMPWDASTRSIHDRLLLRAVSDNPVTLSSVAVPGSAGAPPVPPVPVVKMPVPVVKMRAVIHRLAAARG